MPTQETTPPLSPKLQPASSYSTNLHSPTGTCEHRVSSLHWQVTRGKAKLLYPLTELLSSTYFGKNSFQPIGLIGYQSNRKIGINCRWGSVQPSHHLLHQRCPQNILARRVPGFNA